MGHTFRSIILWREPRVTGAIFGFGLLLYIALSLYSVILVFTCISIPMLAVTLIVRAVLATKAIIFKQPNDNPFRCWLDEKWEVKGERVNSINRRAADFTNCVVLHAKNVILVKDFIESLKGLLFLLIWYYIGKNISTLTLIFVGYIGLFSLPLLYDLKRKEIDGFLWQVNRKYEDFYQRMVEIIPGSIAQPKSQKKSKEKKDSDKED